MICPKCGRPVEPNAVICSGCDFILDTDFLGDEILDEEQSLRPGIGGVDPAVFNLADAVILGDLDEQAQSFETSDSGFHVRESTNARLYVSGRSQAMMAPDAVPAILPDGLTSVRLTPFEKHVLSFIDGKRPVEIIRIRAGLDESEVKTALATLADKGVVEVVGRALVETDFFEETAQRRARQPRRSHGAMAGAVGAALGTLRDETDRAIEEAFRTQTGLNPLAAEEIAPPADDDGNVFSSLSADPLGDEDLELPSELAGSAEGGSLSHDTALSLRPDDDLPSDADNFDLLAHTSEIERSPQIAASVPTRGGLGPMATNARRVLSDPELADILGDDPSDGFDDFGEVSELNTALLPGVDSSLSQGLADSEVFKSVTGTAQTPSGARPDAAAMAELQRRQRPLASESESGDGTATGLRPQIAQASPLSDLLSEDGPSVGFPSDTPAMPVVSSGSDEDIDADLLAPLGPSSDELDGEAMPLAPTPDVAVAAAQLDDGGDLADLVGEDPLSLEGTETSKVGSAVDRPVGDVHSVITAAPALQLDPMADSASEDVDPFHGLDLEESDEGGALRELSLEGSVDLSLSDEEVEPTAARTPFPSRSDPRSSEEDGVVGGASDDLASSSEGTAAFAENPFADELVEAGAGDDDEEPATSTRPRTGEVEKRQVSSEVSVIYEVDEDEVAERYEGATDGVPSLGAAARAPSGGGLLDAFSDDDEAALAPSLEDPKNRPPQLSEEVSAPDRSFSESEELIDDAMIIRPAAATMQVRGASVLERPKGRATPVSVEVSAPHDDVEISASSDAVAAASVPSPAAPSSQETAHLDRPQEIAALSLAAPRSRSEETALFSGVGDVPPASELSQGDAWASRAQEAAPGKSIASESSSSSQSGEVASSGDSTHVLAAPSGRPAPPPSSEASQAPPPDDEGDYAPLTTGQRNDPDAMREKARKLFEDAMKDYREGRIGAARMNAKLATIYDPANEEYRTALEQWGKGGRRRAQQQASSYAVLYEEAQEREGNGDVEGAVTLLLQGAEEFPDIAAIQNRLGVLLAIHKREYDRASAYIQRAIELDPENLHYKSNLGKILSRRRERQKRANG